MTETHSNIIEYRDPQTLRPHPKGVEVYGQEDLDGLVGSIRELGVLEPLSILASGTIISGHRRYRAALAAHLPNVPCIVTRFASELDELEAIVEHNRYRAKTLLQLANEGKLLETIYAERARQRQLAHLKQGNAMPVVENFPQRGDEAKTRDQVAQAIGLGSGKQWDKLSYVAERAQAGDEVAQKALVSANTVHEAYQAVKRREQHQIVSSIPLEEGQFPSSIRIYHEDSRNLRRHISEPVALCVTSPPYNCGTPYQGYDDRKTWQEWDSLLQEVFAQVYDVLLPGGRVAINLPLHRTSRENGDFPAMRAWPILRSLGYEPMDALIWLKARSQPEIEALVTPLTSWGSWRSPSQPYLRSVLEVVWIVTKPGRFHRNGTSSDLTEEEFKNWTVNLWSIPPAPNGVHPAAFPRELPRRLIKLYTYPGQVILDPFMGVGTVAEAALELGRHFVGFEVSGAYVSEAQRRLSAAGERAAQCP